MPINKDVFVAPESMSSWCGLPRRASYLEARAMRACAVELKLLTLVYLSVVYRVWQHSQVHLGITAGLTLIAYPGCVLQARLSKSTISDRLYAFGTTPLICAVMAITHSVNSSETPRNLREVTPEQCSGSSILYRQLLMCQAVSS